MTIDPPPPPPPSAGTTSVEDLISERVRLELMIRSEVERQSHKEEKKRLAELTKHPAVLLVLTFFLTTLVGSVVTSWWQYQQWARQQALQANQEVTKERIAVITLTAQSVAASFAAAEDVLHLFAFVWHRDSQVVTLKERAAHWTNRSRDWRVAEKILTARVRSAFPDAMTRDLLQSIMDDRTFVGNDIENLLSMADTKRGRYTADDVKDIEETAKHALDLVNGVSRQDQKLARLISHMIEETRKAEQTPPPKPLWRWLLSW